MSNSCLLYTSCSYLYFILLYIFTLLTYFTYTEEKNYSSPRFKFIFLAWKILSINPCKNCLRIGFNFLNYVSYQNKHLTLHQEECICSCIHKNLNLFIYIYIYIYISVSYTHLTTFPKLRKILLFYTLYILYSK